MARANHKINPAYHCTAKIQLGYRHNSYEFEISVSNIEEPRYVYYRLHGYSDVAYDISLGDSITIPIYFADHTSSHRFSDKSRYEQRPQFDIGRIKHLRQRTHSNFQSWEVDFRADELDFWGIQREQIMHRSLMSATVSYAAIFRAKRPGSFNLRLGNYVSIPVSICSPTESVHGLASMVRIYQWDNTSSSWGGQTYWLKNVALRVGDILKAEFLTYKDIRDNPKVVPKKLRIDKTPFRPMHSQLDHWIGK